ncbi:MAG: NAD(P)H-dependent oxidoreductase subunit E [Chloroflexota bacterium]|nr:NAD(P)H-dependent oxidoreductase subunit E [Chloroflexota bacterium]
MMLAEKYAERIEKIFSKYPTKRSAVMPLLYVAQEEYGYITPEGINEVAALCDLDPTQVRSIAGFYTMYRERPKGKYWLQVCTDLACALKGADEFYDELLHELELDHDHDTTEDGVFSVEHVMCLGACDRAPMMQCNFHFSKRYDNLDIEQARALIAEMREQAKSANGA